MERRTTAVFDDIYVSKYDIESKIQGFGYDFKFIHSNNEYSPSLIPVKIIDYFSDGLIDYFGDGPQKTAFSMYGDDECYFEGLCLLNNTEVKYFFHLTHALYRSDWIEQTADLSLYGIRLNPFSEVQEDNISIVCTLLIYASLIELCNATIAFDPGDEDDPDDYKIFFKKWCNTGKKSLDEILLYIDYLLRTIK